MPLKIKHIFYGIACRIGDTIYIHKDLQKHSQKLYNAILGHEKKHSRNLSRKDVSMDIINEDIKNLKREYYSFVLTHPSSWTEFSPVWIYEDKLAWNVLILALYIITGGLIWLIASLLK